MKRKSRLTGLLIAGCFCVALGSACRSVKSYQKNKLNDGDMVLAGKEAEKFEKNAQVYREGGSGANGGKSGGGCGCN